HWQGDHGVHEVSPDTLATALMTLSNHPGEYLDAHAWQFTPSSFRAILDLVFALGLSPLRIERVYETILGACGFYAVLREASDERPPPIDTALPPDFDEQAYLIANPDVAQAGVDPRIHYITFGRRENRRLR